MKKTTHQRTTPQSSPGHVINTSVRAQSSVPMCWKPCTCHLLSQTSEAATTYIKGALKGRVNVRDTSRMPPSRRAPSGLRRDARSWSHDYDMQHHEYTPPSLPPTFVLCIPHTLWIRTSCLVDHFYPVVSKYATAASNVSLPSGNCTLLCSLSHYNR